MKYEKVDEYTIKVTKEISDNLDLADMLNRKEIMEKQVVDLEQKLLQAKDIVKNITAIIEEAKKLGITPKVDKNPPSAKNQIRPLKTG